MASDPKRAAGDRRDGRDGTVDPTFGASLRYWEPGAAERAGADANASIPCGWGRLIFAHTFHDPDTLIDVLTHEAPDERDIALYVTDPHVVLARAPQDVFLDPSHTYRRSLGRHLPPAEGIPGVTVRPVRSREEAQAINAIYARCKMVQVPVDFVMAHRDSRSILHLIAWDEAAGRVIGTVTGVDHLRAFNDPENGSSLWCLAVDPQAGRPGVGEALPRRLIELFQMRGRSWMDLSVMHDNGGAIALYEKLGFLRVPAFCLKHKSAINEHLFVGPDTGQRLNPYARIIINEARRRGIGVEVEEADGGQFRLVLGGRRVDCRESLSALTSAVAMSRCDDKALTLRLLARAGLKVPEQVEASDEAANADFLAWHGRIVVKPARGEQGRGITVDVRDAETLSNALAAAASVSDRVILEQFAEGQDLRIIVIGHEVGAAAGRRPAEGCGDGGRRGKEVIEAEIARAEVYGETTTLLRSAAGNSYVMNPEALLSALEACGVDNARIEVEGGSEVPMADGSALTWALEVHKAGVTKCDDADGGEHRARAGRVAGMVTVTGGANRPGAFVSFYPHEEGGEGEGEGEGETGTILTAGVDYLASSEAIGRQWVTWKTSDASPEDDFANHFRWVLAPARTVFPSYEAVEELFADGLIQAGPDGCCVVAEGDGWYDPNLVRFPLDEAARHAAQRLVGVLSLCAAPGGRGLPSGHIVSYDASPEMMIAFANKLKREMVVL